MVFILIVVLLMILFVARCYLVQRVRVLMELQAQMELMVQMGERDLRVLVMGALVLSVTEAQVEEEEAEDLVEED